MAIDQYRKWEPLKNIPARLYCEGLHDDYEGFRIILRGETRESRTLRIMFDPALTYRNTDESYLLQLTENIKALGEVSLYIVDNSTWVKQFHQESCDIYREKNIVHYAIITPNDCIEVLSEYEPKVEWLN